MAHEISMFDGVGEAAFAMRPAWHGLGVVLPHVPTSEEMIEAAHLRWRVGAREMVTSDGRQVPGHFATVREDTGAVLGVVSDRYKIVQNADAFNFLDSLLQDGVIRYESAGALKGGRVVWALARMPSQDEIAPGDVSRRYVLFSIREKKVAAVRGALMNYRNQLPSIRGTWWSLLNAVTETVDHDQRRNYGTPEARENRMLSTLDGAGADFKTKAMSLAVEMAA